MGLGVPWCLARLDQERRAGYEQACKGSGCLRRPGESSQEKNRWDLVAQTGGVTPKEPVAPSVMK